MEVCSRNGCQNEAAYIVGKRQWYCVQCTWIVGRRRHARARGKYVPVWDVLQSLMVSDCPHCGITMRYERSKTRRGLATIQHYDDGTIGVICHACNTAHGHSKLGDSWFSVPLGHKYCPRCSCIKSVIGFHKNSSSFTGLHSACKECRKGVMLNVESNEPG